jgi:L-fuculose-phosphate aldolase
MHSIVNSFWKFIHFFLPGQGINGRHFIETQRSFLYYSQHPTMDNTSRAEIARHLISVCRLLAERGFVTATDGNVSTRLPNGNILVTPTAHSKSRVSETDLVEVTIDGTAVTLSRRPSTELDMHLCIYRRREDVRAVVHAHPTYATGFATARIPLNECLFPEVIVGLGSIPLAPYATPSTKEVGEALAPFIQQANAILLSNHGVVTYGTDLDDAYFKMEKVEHAAHTTFVARMLGGARALTAAEFEKLREISTSSYGREVPTIASCDPAEETGFSDADIKRFIKDVLKEKK